ncbi:MAG: hypothetical protein IJM21_04445 [Clostridia bacterium]|nr:hypothetical protein [Clostridia bacterium]
MKSTPFQNPSFIVSQKSKKATPKLQKSVYFPNLQSTMEVTARLCRAGKMKRGEKQRKRKESEANQEPLPFEIAKGQRRSNLDLEI